MDFLVKGEISLVFLLQDLVAFLESLVESHKLIIMYTNQQFYI